MNQHDMAVKGGKARWKKVPKKERTRLARAAALKRWKTVKIQLAWDDHFNFGVSKYRISWGTKSGQYTKFKFVKRCPAVVGGLRPKTKYFFAVAGIGMNGEEGNLSEEICTTTPE